MGGDHKPVLLCHGDLKQRRFCKDIGVPEHVGCGEGFVGEGKSRLIEYAPFQDDPAKVAALVECGSHWKAASGPVRFHYCINEDSSIETEDSSLEN